MDSKHHNGQNGVSNHGHHQNNDKALENIPTSRGVAFVIRKTEKLTTALYMVTDIMSEKDPMKWKVREIGVDILSDITVSANASASERMSVFRTVMRKIERLVSFLDIAQSAQMMSEMNASVLKKEYLSLRESIGAEWHHVYDDGKRALSGSFVEEKEHHVLPQSTPVAPSVPHEPQVAHSEVPEREARVFATVAPGAPEEVARTSVPKAEQSGPDFSTAHVEPSRLHIERIHPQQRIPVPVSPSVRPVSLRPRLQLKDIRGEAGFGRARSDSDRDDRRKIILALIKQKPSLTVKDIVKSIPQVSEKTIQRELLAMVSEGQLIKKGERRWSTYSLIEG